MTGGPTSSTAPAAELEANRANWDERVPGHLRAYDADGFVADPARVTSVAREDMALMAPHLPAPADPARPLAGLDLLHLQCHVGTDTLSYARAGAAVTGLDLSPASVAAAGDLAVRTGLGATFIQADVARAGATLDGATTSIGVLTWIADLRPWAGAIAAALRGGGLFFLRDGHPALHADDADDSVRLTAGTTYEWPHPTSEVVQALLDAGLVLTSLAERTTVPWRALPSMVETESGWALPERRERLPLTFSLTARRP